MTIVDDLTRDPHPALHAMRADGPAVWIDELDVWLITTHELCRQVMLDSGTFTVDDPRFTTQQVIGPSMLSLDGLEHRRHRDPFSPSFRASRIRDLEQLLRDQAAQFIGEIVDTGGGDLRGRVAGPLAAGAMAHLLDLEEVEVADILDWYQAIVGAVHVVTTSGVVPEAGRDAFAELHSTVARSMSGSELLGSVDNSGSLTVDEIVSNVAVLLFGGIVTAESSTAIAFTHLLANGAIEERLRARPEHVGSFVEESFRLEPSAAVVDRYATRDVALGGVTIEAGDLVRVSLSAANRDPAVFPAPDVLNIDRPNLGQSLTFARGPHACLGIHLARLETRVAVEMLLGHSNRWDLVGQETIAGLIFRAPESVQVLERR